MDQADKVAESFLAPVGSMLPADDMRVIERDGWYQIITPSTKSVQGNEVVYSRVAAHDAERVARETMDDYAALGLPFKWCVGPLTEPVDFGGLLDRLGFDSWAVRGMAVEPQRWTYTPHDDVAIERVTPATFEDYYTTLVRGWAMEVAEGASWRTSLRRALDGDLHHCYVARVAGEPVGTAGMIVKQRSVYLVGGNVLESHRGRGIYRALIDERLRDAAALGFTLATTQAREATSAPILHALGFETLFQSRVYKWQR
ncbi:MAG TPA: GNAT family N-acetyltransferase [Kofleriaceae bacterium]